VGRPVAYTDEGVVDTSEEDKLPGDMEDVARAEPDVIELTPETV
jgi:hypothetical protein